MDQVEYKIIDNVIFTSDVGCKPDPKGVGHYYYSKMVKNQNKIAQIDGYTKEEDTFGSLLQRSVRTALAMTDNGIKPGDHISMCTFNHLNSVVPLTASYFTGSIMGAIDPTMNVEEAVHLLKQTLPKIIFTAPTAVELVEKVVQKLETETTIVVFGETSDHTPFSQFVLPHQNENEFKPKEVESLNTTALIIFSSGVTGMPKGICHSHLSMLYLPEQATVENQYNLYSISYPYWIVCPMYFHVSVESGSTRIVYPSFNINEPWTAFYQHVDFAFINAWQTLRMVQSKKPANVNLNNVKVLHVGGNSLTLKQLNDIKSVLPHTAVFYIYSQSELFKSCFSCLIYGTALQKRNELSVGTIHVGHSYKIVDIETEEIVGPNRIGELYIKSPNQFTGYFNKDSCESLDSNGWLKTGDLFYYNEDLCFYIVGRIKDTFKNHICHISPAEIESVILDLEPIETVVVIGIPHETDVHKTMAVVKLKPNTRKLSAEEVIKYVETKLGENKWLTGGVTFVDSFPTTVNGRVNRFKLTKMILNDKTSTF